MRLEEYLTANGIQYRRNVPLSELCGMNLRGQLNFVASPSSTEQLKGLYQFAISKNLSFEIVGGLTNTYLCEGLTRDIIIRTDHIQEVKWSQDVVEVSSGYNLNKLAIEISRLGKTNYEGFIGIPGTVGAAAINNSGAFGAEVSEVLKCATILTPNGKEMVLSKDDFSYGPRYSKLKYNAFGLLLTVTLDISNRCSQDIIDSRITKIRKYRKLRKEWDRKSLGSIFVGKSIASIWQTHPLRNIIRKSIYMPFKYTKFRRKAQCLSEFIALGNLRFIKNCDNIGRFCWDENTKEKVFFEYIDFVKKMSDQKAILEIDIKR